MRTVKWVVAALVWSGSVALVRPALYPPGAAVVYGAEDREDDLDGRLAAALLGAGFTGTVESQVEARLSRKIDPERADLGRLLFFDKLHSLFHDNTCGGCHSPTNGFGDTQSIAIGVQNNNLVGPDRSGPRNQRRSPLVINTAFYPALMWNGRFNAASGDPFDNSAGFHFPPPEGDVRFPPHDPLIRHLLQAQAHIPPTELVEVAGFAGICAQEGPGSPFCQFDQTTTGEGLQAETVPRPILDHGVLSRNEPIRQRALAILNGSPAYRRLFRRAFPEAKGAPIDFGMFGRAIAEFEFTLVFADAPLDRFARGDRSAMTAAQKRGALLFFGEAGCVACHSVAGRSNEMFSDFQNHVLGVPQLAPVFGRGSDNVVFDGPGSDEDFGLEQVTGDSADRYKFRTAPLRNLAVSPAFFHNGAFTTLEAAIRHHLTPVDSGRFYDPFAAGVDLDLAHRLGPIDPVLFRLDQRLRSPRAFTEREFNDLVAFVREGLFDERAAPERLCRLVPPSVPSGLPVMTFQACRPAGSS